MKFCKTIKEFAIITVGTAIVAAAVFFLYKQSHMSAMLVMFVIFGVIVLASGIKINWKIFRR